MITGTVYSQSLEGKSLMELKGLNTSFHDQAPFYDSYNKLLYYSESNDKGDLDVKRAKWTGQEWIRDSNWKFPFNNTSQNEIYHIDSIGNIYFQGGYMDDQKGKMIYGIFKSRYQNGKYSKPKKLRIKYFKNKSQDQSFCISNDGKVLILSMEAYSTTGVEDLYVSFLNEDSTWTEPKNLGTTINTPFEEFTPYLMPDKRSLYFSSNGHKGGYGSKDIWVSYRKDDTWSNWTEVKNLGPSINTKGMETSFRAIDHEKYEYLITSSRTSSGHSDIFVLRDIDNILDSLTDDFEIEIEPEIIDSTITLQDSIISSIDSPLIEEAIIRDTTVNHLQIAVFAADSKKELSALILYETGKVMDSLNHKIEDISIIPVAFGDSIHLTIKSLDFLPQSKTVIFENQNFGISIKEEFFLDSLVLGKSVKLENVLFKRGTPELLNNSFENLDLVISVLNDRKELNIEIAGHTDNSGNPYLNLLLSEKRAKSIKKYLVEKGIEASRISTIGYGGEKPIASNDSEETMKLNRRVEFKLSERQDNNE